MSSGMKDQSSPTLLILERWRVWVRSGVEVVEGWELGFLGYQVPAEHHRQ